MVKHLITDISEEDFKKLNLTVFEQERVDYPDGSHKFELVPKELNKIFDNEIMAMVSSGRQDDLDNLNLPITIAIHEDNEKLIQGQNKSAWLTGYWDKFMNRFSGVQTYQLGIGIKHLYSTRDYYEAHEDYWRVRKDETKVIYRIKVSKEHIDSFKLKFRDVRSNEVEYDKGEYHIKECVVTHYSIDDNGEEHLLGRTLVRDNGFSVSYLPYDDSNNAEQAHDDKDA